MFRPSRNFKVPQVYGGQWKNHQTFQKWDPISKRLVQVACCPAPAPAPQPECDTSWYPTYGYVIYETHLDVYPYGPFYFWCTSDGTTEDPPVPAYEYSSITSTAIRCGQSYTVFGEVTPCPEPDPAVSMTLANLTATGGDVTFVYPGSETTLVLEMYTSATSSVDVDGTPIQTFIGSLVSPNTYTFTTVLGNYYRASLRVRHDCGGGVYSYSTPIYSGTVQYV